MVGAVQEDEGDQRLGKRELGRHAYERQMPKRIAEKLAAEDDSNKLKGIVPQLQRLLSTCTNIRTAHLCDESVLQIWKISGEGNHFCGYRNAQMLVPDLHHKTVLQMQDLIEEAWEIGYNTVGKHETGGIAGTRKHIGTSEIDALLCYLHIPSAAQAFSGKSAYQELLDWTEDYFKAGDNDKVSTGVVATRLPPVYLQMPFHSVTIIGCCRTDSGRQLLVLDPGLFPPSVFRDGPKQDWTPTAWQKYRCLWAYQRGEQYLKRHRKFEVLQLLPMTPQASTGEPGN